MGLFVFGKKEQASNEGPKDAKVKVLGSGCAKCNELEANVKAALKEMGLDLAVGHVKDFKDIAAYGVMTTPALVLNETVVSSGKLLKKDEVIALLKQANF